MLLLLLLLLLQNMIKHLLTWYGMVSQILSILRIFYTAINFQHALSQNIQY